MYEIRLQFNAELSLSMGTLLSPHLYLTYYVYLFLSPSVLYFLTISIFLVPSPSCSLTLSIFIALSLQLYLTPSPSASYSLFISIFLSLPYQNKLELHIACWKWQLGNLGCWFHNSSSLLIILNQMKWEDQHTEHCLFLQLRPRLACEWKLKISCNFQLYELFLLYLKYWVEKYEVNFAKALDSDEIKWRKLRSCMTNNENTTQKWQQKYHINISSSCSVHELRFQSNHFYIFPLFQ